MAESMRPRSENDDPIPPGTTFGRYTIVRRIGVGGMGAVYEATHNHLKKRVAIKTLHPMMASNPEISARFLREGESASKIRHPHVVDIYDVGTTDGITYLVMEYLDGQDLGALLKTHGTLSPQRVTDIMLPVAAALLAAHEEGVVHRDLKPGNIFLAKSRHGEAAPKVLDFGISKIVGPEHLEGLTTTGALLGTPHFMSPEQAHGGRGVDGRSDEYSLGVILYLAVTGKKPFMADSMYQVLHKIVEGDLTAPRLVRPDLPEAFEKVILRAMATKPERRYPTMREFGEALLPFASERGRAQWAPVFSAHGANSLPPPQDVATTPMQPALLAEPSQPSGVGLTSTLSQTGIQNASTIALGRDPRLLLGIGGLVVLAAVVGGLWLTQSNREQPLVTSMPAAEAPEASPPSKEPVAAPAPKSFSIAVRAVPPSAVIELDGSDVGRGQFQADLPADGREHRLVVKADGFQPAEHRFRDAPPPSVIELQAAAPPPPAVAAKPAREKAASKPQAPRVKPVRSAEEQPRRGVNDAPILR